MAQQDPREPRRFKIRHIFFGLLLLLLGWFAFFRVSVHLNVNRRIRELRAQGYPMSLEELGASYTLPAGADNAADYYMTAFSHYVAWDDEAREGLPWVGKGDRPTRTGAIEPEIKERAERFLAANEQTLSLLHEAVASESCRYPIDFVKEFGADVSWLPAVRKSAFLLSLDGLVACEHADPNRAMASVHATLALAKSLNSPVLIHYLVHIAVQAIAYRNAERLLNRIPLSEEQLQNLSRWLETYHEGEGFRKALIGERCFGADMFRGSSRQLANHVMGSVKLLTLFMVPRKILGLHDSDMLSYIDLIQDHIDPTELPRQEQFAAYRADEDGPGGSRRVGLLTRMLAPALLRIFQLEMRCVAHRRVVLTALAIERFRLAEGELPQALSDLVPTYLDAVPKDPFDGEDLKYRTRDVGYVVYSVGDDRSDDGGTDKEERKRNADGQTLWDVTFFVER